LIGIFGRLQPRLPLATVGLVRRKVSFLTRMSSEMTDLSLNAHMGRSVPAAEPPKPELIPLRREENFRACRQK